MPHPVQPPSPIPVGSATCAKLLLLNGWPLLLTALVGLTLILSLGHNPQLFGVSLPLDAAKWPVAPPVIRAHAPSQTPGDAKPDLPSTLSKPLDGGMIHSILVLTTYLLIVFNTVLYLKENEGAPRKKGKGNRRLKVAWWITLAFEIVTVLLLYQAYQDLRHGVKDDAIFSAGAALVIFIAFIVVDIMNYTTLRDEHIIKATDVRVGEEKTFALNQALLVDLPVVIGILASLSLAFCFTGRLSETEEYYLVGFFSGAAVMHLAISQVIFIILAFKKEYALAKLGV